MSILWSDGPGGWKSSTPLFNIFPIAVPPPVAPSSPGLPDGPPSTYFSYVQTVPASQWTIAHNLGRNPSVVAFDENNKPILGTVTYLSINELVVVFPAPVAGFAYLTGVLDTAIAAGLAS